MWSISKIFKIAEQKIVKFGNHRLLIYSMTNRLLLIL